MCGIAGQINLSGEPVDRRLIEGMVTALRRRGPDDQGIHLAGPVGLGHARLSIIDRSPAGHQPMANEDGSVWIVMNGEIYNFAELRTRLVRQGHPFRSRTDTEVILHLWEEEGPGCLRHLRGMFAFALWDANRQLFFAARDRVGKKPFKYFFDGQHFVFASELKAFQGHPLIRFAPDFKAIRQMLGLNHVPAPRTGFLKIKKLLAGHWLIIERGKLRVERYWQLDFERQTDLSYDEAKAEVLRLLRESVRLRLVADVPVGAFLSGGIDSSTVVALMSEASARVRTFAIGFPEAGFDERPAARLVAQRFRTEHTEFEVRPDAAQVLPELVEQYEEPYADSSALPTYSLAQLTRQHVTVALNGDGGDEAFGGYRRYVYWRLLHWLIPNLYQRIAQFAYFSSPGFDWVFSDDFLADGLGERPGGPLRRLDDVFSLSFTTFLPDDLLTKVDLATMRFSLEGRSPFLDHHLLEFAAQLPVGWKLRGLTTKRILKDAVRGLLPAAILDRPKQGFELPVNQWFRDPLADWARSILLDDRTLRRGYFRSAGLERLLTEQRTGRARHGQRIWTLICLELWHRAFLDGQPR